MYMNASFHYCNNIYVLIYEYNNWMLNQATTDKKDLNHNPIMLFHIISVNIIAIISAVKQGKFTVKHPQS